MEISNQLLFPSSLLKLREIDGTRRVNYTPTIFLLNECSLSWPEKSIRQSWVFLNKLFRPAFQFRNLLLKSITNPFIFSIAIDVEKMVVWWVNNWTIGKRMIQVETNYLDPHKKHNSSERDDSVLFLFRVLFLSFTFIVKIQILSNLTRNKNNTSNRINSLIFYVKYRKNHPLSCII